MDRWRGLTLERGQMATRRRAEHPPVFPAELGRALVPDPERRLASVEPFPRHQPPRLLEPEPLLVLERAQGRYALEVEVERRWAHPHVLCERFDPERLGEVVP